MITQSVVITRGNWAELTFANISGIVTGAREKYWPMAEAHKPE